MSKTWNVLVVDDDPDVHTVTQLAIKHKKWRGRGFNLVSALSGAEAKKILSSSAGKDFQVALVDVVMETERAGLDVCEFIRATMPMSLRIVLRTGQPGAAPEDAVMNDYDIDYYLAKTEVTPERLFMTLRAGCRSSIDLATSLALESQLKQFVDALQSAATGANEIAQIMIASLVHLEHKHDVGLCFVDDATCLAAGEGTPAVVETLTARGLDVGAVARAMLAAQPNGGLVQGSGLPEGQLVFPLRALHGTSDTPADKKDSKLGRVMRFVLGGGDDNDAVKPVIGGIHVRRDTPTTRKEQTDLARDLASFGENYRVAAALLSLRERTVHDRMAALESTAASAM